MPLTLFSPAKINLFLRVLRKREDGFHEIASLFQTIGFGDTLTFSLSQTDQLTCSDPTLACDSSNLIFKALHLFRTKTALRSFVKIHLDKHIPTQAGLGGGSSNAATTLFALNALHNHPVSEQQLQIWSAEIGSDIPFFFSQGTAYCTGRGEKVRNMPPPPTFKSFSLIKPKAGLSTPAIYRALKLSQCSKQDPEQLLESFYQSQPQYLNDLEPPALELCKELATVKEYLKTKSPDPVFMTGSGTAIIKVCAEGELAPLNRKSNTWYSIPVI